MASGSQTGMHSLSTIIKRLEAVTSRLEDVATTGPQTGSAIKSPTASTHDAVAGHAGAPPAPPPPPPAPPSAAPAADDAPFVKAYQDEVVDGALTAFVAKSKEIGGLVEQHAALYPALITAQLEFLRAASQHGKPAQKDLAPLLKPQADAIQAITEAKDKLSRAKEGRELGTLLSTMGDGAPAWGWVQVEPTPVPFVTEMKGAAQFWADRANKQFKDDKPELVEWTKSFMAVIEALRAYVKQWHTTGVTWKAGAPAATAAAISSASAPAAAAGGPPPPPPPPPAGAPAPAAGASAAGGHAALLADLNRGGSVTSGLKKVDASQMTHKNPELRTSSVVPDKQGAPAVKPKPGNLSQAPKKPPKMELEDGNKWLVEYQEGNKEISIDQTELHQTVHLYSCTNSVVRISGKINAVTMGELPRVVELTKVGCKKCAIVLDSAVSSLSITASPSFEVQITGSLPTIQIDNTDSGQIYLSKECMEVVEIITSKTSALNISVPTGADGDFEERPVPEQMKSKVVKGKLVTEIVEHSG